MFFAYNNKAKQRQDNFIFTVKNILLFKLKLIFVKCEIHELTSYAILLYPGNNDS